VVAIDAARAVLAGALAAGTLVAGALPAQLSATLDAGLSQVHYDGFLPSGAAALTPAVRLERRSAVLTGRGTVLMFESGNRSVQGLIAGSAFTPERAGVRAELSGTVGASTYDTVGARRYQNVARFAHALGRGRLHHAGAGGGVWLGGTLGRTTFGDSSPRAVTAVAGGAWARRREATLTATLTRTRVGDTAYTDLEGYVRWARGALEVDGFLGVRGWGRGGGRGVFSEAIATARLTGHLALVLSGGRYPTDPTRGSIAGRYVSAALRVAIPRRPPPGPRLATSPPRAAAPAPDTAVGDGRDPPALEVRAGRGAARTLRVRAPGASRVEVMGDFTHWEPVQLSRAGPDLWEATLPIASGMHRLNVRIDGGPWSVPRGTIAVTDDFGGRVGLVVVP
jgi:hypothetical protein